MTDDSPYKKIDPPADKIRKMDCIDCHNRATHRFEAPDVLMNRAIAKGDISPSIPMIKVKGLMCWARYTILQVRQSKRYVQV